MIIDPEPGKHYPVLTQTRMHKDATEIVLDIVWAFINTWYYVWNCGNVIRFGLLDVSCVLQIDDCLFEIELVYRS